MGGVSIGGRRAKGTALGPEWFVAQSLILSSGGSLGVVVLLTAAVRGDGGGGMNSFRSPKWWSRLCSERQLGAEVGDLAVFGAAAQSRSGGVGFLRSDSSKPNGGVGCVRSSSSEPKRLSPIGCVGCGSSKPNGGIGCVGSGSSELKWGIRLCWEWQLGAEWWS